ncbi:IS110 family transposase [Variovorax sp. J31P179]|uniref:IS110 family transposase n=1 Tax=Variovorax sp. J31P179 TaxID=3053508 RepID=UPI00257900C9|nr:IS110 family transposase [Variovorax sp. J31P179]MDM0085768.1 IS110 family transposase [Variovorax sp. J31P179]
MTTTWTALRRQETAKPDDLYMSFELGDKQWKLSVGDGRNTLSRFSIAAGDQVAVTDCIVRAGKRFKTPSDAHVHTCYEAGRDGWWLHRWLSELGVDNIVVDAASIEVNRRARRAKTDRLDADKLQTMLVRHHRGERVWSVLREPSKSDEDERREHRELERLIHERTSHTNRIGSLLVLHNLRPRVHIGGRDWSIWWAQHGEQLGRKLCAEIERELARLQLVKEQVRQIEAARRNALQQREKPMVAQLMSLRGIGEQGAWVLVHEIFGWRRFANRRELAGCLGLAPTPYASGDSQVEQGISKAGNRRARTLLVELAWGWLRLQPGSAIARWFNKRFAGEGARMRRVGIVALARRLAIALWHFLQDGEIPAGAQMKVVQT